MVVLICRNDEQSQAHQKCTETTTKISEVIAEYSGRTFERFQLSLVTTTVVQL